ncbi:MAG: aspartate aminotransferase family protein [Deltaproteobacteria bacterium]|nr:aspartate aminotransferase family protein [Deltaproteobacteria bacterium]
MPFNIKNLFEEHKNKNLIFHEQFINPQFVRVLRTIGFDKIYERAEGAYLYDQEGSAYLDFLSGYGSFNIGRNHPVVAQAIKDVLDLKLPNMIQMGVTLLPGLLAKELLQLCSDSIDTVFFTNSGTESVEGALKFAKAHTRRDQILYLDHAFHGLSIGSLSVNGNEEFRKGFGRLLEPTQAVYMNDLEALEKALSSKQFAAFIVESIQGKGVYVPAPDFLPEAQRLCRKYGTLFIADEIQTGFGRTGRFFAFEHWNLEPDIITIAKSLSGGYVPVGAILMRRAIYESTFTKMDRCVVHSSTFGKNDLAMAAGLATLWVLREEKLLENSHQLGTYLLEGLNALKSKYEMLKEVRGKGLMIALEFGEPKSLKLKVGWKMVHAASKGLFGQMVVVPLFTQHKILSQVPGHNMDVIKILPPLMISQKEADLFITAIDQVMDACHKFPGAAWEVGYTLAKQALKAST